MKNLTTLQSMIALLLTSMFLLSSCGTEADDENPINPNIIKIIDCCVREDEKFVSGDFFMGQISGDELIATGPISTFNIDSNFQIVSQEEIWRDIIEIFDDPFGTGFYFTANNSQDKILFVKSLFGNRSIGSIFEYDLSSNNLFHLKDSTYNISSAVYWHGDDTRIVYYSYGNDEGLEAGYYLHNKSTGADSLLLAHRSSIGPSEMLNGFDLSPDNTRLLIPNVRASFSNPVGPQTPQIVEYDLQTQQADTFDVEFDLSFVRIGLWLRYSPDGSRILYSNFPLGSFTPTTNDDSEVGIIDRETMEKRVLDVNTNPDFGVRSVQLAPTWSSNGKHIIYGSAHCLCPAVRKAFTRYIYSKTWMIHATINEQLYEL